MPCTRALPSAVASTGPGVHRQARPLGQRAGGRAPTGRRRTRATSVTAAERGRAPRRCRPPATRRCRRPPAAAARRSARPERRRHLAPACRRDGGSGSSVTSSSGSSGPSTAAAPPAGRRSAGRPRRAGTPRAATTPARFLRKRTPPRAPISLVKLAARAAALRSGAGCSPADEQPGPGGHERRARARRRPHGHHGRGGVVAAHQVHGDALPRARPASPAGEDRRQQARVEPDGRRPGRPTSRRCGCRRGRSCPRWCARRRPRPVRWWTSSSGSSSRWRARASSSRSWAATWKIVLNGWSWTPVIA